MKRAICPGTYDPVTKGHLDIIERASGLFDELIVLVVVNPADKPSFTGAERVAMLKKITAQYPNVKVDQHQGLLADYVRAKDAMAIVKGLRALSDFESEFQMALTNKQLVPEAETVFMTTSVEHMYLASSLVKQVASFNGDISEFVPEPLLDEIKRRLSGRFQNTNGVL